MILGSDEIQKWLDSHPEKFELNIDGNNQPTWTDYIEQYRFVVYLLSNNRNGVNEINRPFLFLVRHFFELLLKENLESKRIKPVRKHDYNSIFQQYQENDLEIPTEVKKAINSVFDLEGDGSCYRYFKNKEGTIYFATHQLIKVYKLFQEYHKTDSANTLFRELTPITEFDNRTKWNLTFHMHEVDSQGQLRTQYDSTIFKLLQFITDDEVSLNEIYLPLLFLIRHSLELALKDNATAITIIESDLEKRRKLEKGISGEHNVSILHNIFDIYLKKINLDAIKDTHFREQIDSSWGGVETFGEIIRTLDNTSRQFRYIPENKKIEINRYSIIEILELYWETDGFLTFVVNTLKYTDIIPFSDDELAEIYGCY